MPSSASDHASASVNWRWRWIVLVDCEAMAVDAFSLRAAFEFRGWRFEHRSISDEPVDEEGYPGSPV